MENENFNKPFKEVPGGHYDQNGFYINPDRSFYDPDKVYFNSKGYDRHGGFYDSNLEYQPGKGWIPELMCYEDEKESVLHNQGVNNEEDDENEDNDDILDQIYMNDKNFDNLVNEMSVENIFNPISKEQKIPEKQEEKKKEQNISPDMLFNKIPENKMPAFAKANKPETQSNIISEQKLEIDSLFN